MGIAGFEGEDLVSFIPLPYVRVSNDRFREWPLYVWADDDSSVIYKGYTPWRTYYQFTPSEIIKGTYVSENQFTTTGGTTLAPADVNN